MKPETEALLLRLALAQKDCSCKPGHSGYDPYFAGDLDATHRCGYCKGTGKTYLFPDEVRVECNHTNLIGAVIIYKSTNCPLCQGRGWVLSTGPMVWIKALAEIWEGRFISLMAGAEWEAWENKLLHGDFDVALPHAVKALELSGVLQSDGS